MSKCSRHPWRVSCPAFALLIAALPLRADDPPPAEAGYKMVPVTVGEKTAYVKVKEQADPFANVRQSHSDKYDPEAPDFSRTSRYAGKSFMSGSDVTSSHATDDYVKRGFVTQPYLNGKPEATIPNLNTQVTAHHEALGDRSAAGLEKSYGGLNASTATQKVALYADNRPYATQAATLGNNHTDTFASQIGEKTFSDPELKHVRKAGADQANMDGLTMKNLPNRPLTIDEVRELINYGTRPSLQSPSEPESKPLNDPDYLPDYRSEPPPTTLSTTQPGAVPVTKPSSLPPPSAPHVDDDPLPSPGTMGLPPENSEPLPNK